LFVALNEQCHGAGSLTETADDGVTTFDDVPDLGAGGIIDEVVLRSGQLAFHFVEHGQEIADGIGAIADNRVRRFLDQ